MLCFGRWSQDLICHIYIYGVWAAPERTSLGKKRAYYDTETGRALLPPFLPANLLKIQENDEIIAKTAENEALLGWTREVQFYDGETIKAGYKSQLLIEMCNLYINARNSGTLLPSQAEAAKYADILLQAFARVGLDGLIDEATGYKHDPKYAGLRVLLDKYIAEGLQKWMKKFPDKFFELLDEMYGNEKTTSKNRPQYYGHFINKYIYEPIEHGIVKDELNKLNIRDDGTRRARFHQWFNEYGSDVLILQIGQVMGLIQSNSNLKKFKDKFDRIDKPSLLTEEQWEQFWVDN